MCLRAFACLMVALGSAGLAGAGEPSKAKSAGRALVEDLKQAGREIRDSQAGKAAKETGKEIGRSSAELGREVGRISTAAAREVRRVTVRFWDDLLEGKRRKLAKLEKENRALRNERKRGRPQ